MKRLITGIITLSLVVLLGGCKKQAPLNTSFRGLYMGQDITEARAVMIDLLKGDEYNLTIGEVKDGDQLQWHEIGVKGGKYFGLGLMGGEAASGAVTADANGKVNGISLSAVTVQHIWKVDTIDSTAFATAIAADAGLPPLQESDSGLTYASNSGLVVTVDGLGGLVIKNVK